MKYSLGIPNFLEEIASLSHSIVFLYFFALFLSLLAILWNSAFSWGYLSFSPLPFGSLFSAIVRPPQTAMLPFCLFLGMVLITTTAQLSGANPLSLLTLLLAFAQLLSNHHGVGVEVAASLDPVLGALIHIWRLEITDGCGNSCWLIWQEIFSFHSGFLAPFSSKWQESLCWFISLYSWPLLRRLIKLMSHIHDLFFKWLLSYTLRVFSRTNLLTLKYG